MPKLLFLLFLFGVPAALAFMQAYKVQKKWAKADGRLTDGGKILIMRWWLALGAGLVLMGFVFIYDTIDPNFENIGKP